MSEQLNAEDYAGGEIVLVGAGPGDAGLLTLKGLQQIQQAEVVLYDQLVSKEVLNLVRRDAEVRRPRQGRRDRLAIGEGLVRLVDFKTGRAPQTEDDIPIPHLRQMAAKSTPLAWAAIAATA